MGLTQRTRYTPTMPRPPSPQRTHEVSAHLLAEHYPQLSAVIAPLAQPFYMVAPSLRVAENVFYIDWGMPRAASRLLRCVDSYDRLAGADGRGKVFWDGGCGPTHLQWERHAHALSVARERGFEIKPTMEFNSWLKKHMQNCLQAPATAGWPALAASLLKPQ